MFRKTSGAILCPSCGRLTNADAPTCLVCGRRNPGMWGFAGPLRGLFHRRSLVDVVIAACVVLYVLSLVVDPTSFLQRRDLLLDINDAAIRRRRTLLWAPDHPSLIEAEIELLDETGTVIDRVESYFGLRGARHVRPGSATSDELQISLGRFGLGFVRCPPDRERHEGDFVKRTAH